MELIQNYVVEILILVVSGIIARVVFIAVQAIQNDRRASFLNIAFDRLSSAIIDAIISAEHGNDFLTKYQERALLTGKNYKLLYVLDVAKQIAKQYGLSLSEDVLYAKIEAEFQKLNQNATVNGKR
jgi:hypothetical protein